MREGFVTTEVEKLRDLLDAHDRNDIFVGYYRGEYAQPDLITDSWRVVPTNDRALVFIGAVEGEVKLEEDGSYIYTIRIPPRRTLVT